MTILSSRASRSAMMALLSNALSAISASKVESFDQRRDADRVKALSGQQHETHKIAERIGQCQDFGGHSAFRAADGLVLRPPFAPCPWRWTLTLVASTMTYSMSGSSETASKHAASRRPPSPSRESACTRLSSCRRRAADLATDCPCGQSTARLRQTVGCYCRSGRVTRLAKTKRLHLPPLGISSNKSVHPKLKL